MWNRRHLLSLGAALAAQSAWSQPAGARATLQLAHQFAPGSLPARAAEHFAEGVQVQSQGALAVRVHGGGLMGDEREQVSLLRAGRLHLALTGDLVLSGLEERYRVLNMPFLYRDSNHALAVYASPLGDQMRAALAKEGLHTLAWHYIGTRTLTANKPVRTLADLQGLALRLPQDVAGFTSWRALGAEPVHVPFTELTHALELGRVHAQENPPNLIRSSGVYRHQRYLIHTLHLPQRQFIFMSQAVWSGLPATQRRWLSAAAQGAAAWTIRTAREEQASDLQWLQTEGGMELLPFDRSGVAQRLAGVPALIAGPQGAQVAAQVAAVRS